MASPVSRQASVVSANDAGLRGRLEEFGLATVLTFLDLERCTGQLVVTAEERVGRVWLRQGRAIRARIEGSRRTNRAAIYELLSWTRGRFAFVRGDLSAAADEIGAPTTLILVEAARRADEAAAAAASA